MLAAHNLKLQPLQYGSSSSSMLTSSQDTGKSPDAATAAANPRNVARLSDLFGKRDLLLPNKAENVKSRRKKSEIVLRWFNSNDGRELRRSRNEDTHICTKPPYSGSNGLSCVLCCSGCLKKEEDHKFRPRRTTKWCALCKVPLCTKPISGEDKTMTCFKLWHVKHTLKAPPCTQHLEHAEEMQGPSPQRSTTSESTEVRRAHGIVTNTVNSNSRVQQNTTDRVTRSQVHRPHETHARKRLRLSKST